jgi:hypothetical protein
MLNDSQLSRECGVKWFRGPLPPWIVYLRVATWLEPHWPNARALFGATTVAATICKDDGLAMRVAYLLTDPQGLDGWHPVPSTDDPHGGELILASSFDASRRPEPFVPPIKSSELAQWRANAAAAHEYWERWRHHHPPSSWPAVAVEPPVPAPAFTATSRTKPKPTFLRRLFGATK